MREQAARRGGPVRRCRFRGQRLEFEVRRQHVARIADLGIADPARVIGRIAAAVDRGFGRALGVALAGAVVSAAPAVTDKSLALVAPRVRAEPAVRLRAPATVAAVTVKLLASRTVALPALRLMLPPPRVPKPVNPTRYAPVSVLWWSGLP